MLPVDARYLSVVHGAGCCGAINISSRARRLKDGRQVKLSTLRAQAWEERVSGAWRGLDGWDATRARRSYVLSCMSAGGGSYGLALFLAQQAHLRADPNDEVDEGARQPRSTDKNAPSSTDKNARQPRTCPRTVFVAVGVDGVTIRCGMAPLRALTLRAGSVCTGRRLTGWLVVAHHASTQAHHRPQPGRSAGALPVLQAGGLGGRGASPHGARGGVGGGGGVGRVHW
jgi:hypothetical protein